eukprot:Platyproteum_vivax@DN12702_c0_g1_i1.p1
MARTSLRDPLTNRPDRPSRSVCVGTVMGLVIIASLYTWLLIVPEVLTLINWSAATLNLADVGLSDKAAVLVKDTVVDKSRVVCRNGKVWSTYCVAAIFSSAIDLDNAAGLPTVKAWAVAQDRLTLEAWKAPCSDNVCGANLNTVTLKQDQLYYASAVQQAKDQHQLHEAANVGYVNVERSPVHFWIYCVICFVRMCLPATISFVCMMIVLIAYCCPNCCPNCVPEPASVAELKRVELLPQDREDASFRLVKH